MSLAGLDGKIAVVAGGATGIGAACARRLAAEGCSVVVGDVNLDGATTTAQDITAAGDVATPVHFDLAEPESVAELVNTTVAQFGGLDLLFNVGSDMSLLPGDTDVLDIDLAVWERTMTVTLRGYLLALKHSIPHLLARGGGAVVNMASAAAFEGEPTRPAYATAKAGVCALTRHVASRWGRDGLRCNAIAPGLTATAVIRSAPQWPQLEVAALKRMRSTRVGKVDDIAAMVAFLMSAEGAWVNGQTINIDGGTVLR
ncbi:SDR family NAD(P)-dependent oxidoreductase [Mycolicibacterium holsaticum]|uniref:SDR family NAD(P)-dependent oxidoreductase n=1 Tax=Mycolicibacterium holsaticum TaxID=152142 RepID=UPI001C7D0A3D|nr:SDR family oxidoreductase [Mycolicibacterium holsaticum]MDA4106791.1 oxidoreductase [Mycolicibacterium holsaticum DSM 44478 = JCM 12374]QZA14087.1 SDR family oxidoreductase [Mycolicibacterium holsaticum DSM 44478 = JCM 12374]UNC08456.1 SDR family oxidoreductase [Mycolicibacterium holsaticum DSM 44478 = JCM 12374]